MLRKMRSFEKLLSTDKLKYSKSYRKVGQYKNHLQNQNLYVHFFLFNIAQIFP